MALGKVKSNKSKSSTNKLNWNNSKVNSIGKHFLFSDGRLSKDDILKLGNQTLFTKLKSGGYIKEIATAEKGIFKTTDKFRKEYKIYCDSKCDWKSSGGSTHAKGMNKLSKIVPQKIIDEGRFKTGESLKNEFDKYKSSKAFKQEAQRLLEEKRLELSEREALLKNQLENAKSDKQASYFKAVYKSETKMLQMELKTLEEKGFNGYSAPDIYLSMSKDEAEQMLDSLKNSFSQYHQHNYGMIQEAVQKLQQTIEQSETEMISLSIEVFTESYKYEDKCSHVNYEKATGNTTIYLPSK